MKSENILFLDIETVPMASKLEEVPEELRHMFIDKVTKTDEDLTEEEINQRGGLYAEFGKVVCISVG
ncbi:MAG: 3'-5' exonuclease, partial [Paludibacteraceae bacterium]|nr:3'-5' exonuclease [Paludibacteraceae bacterium]